MANTTIFILKYQTGIKMLEFAWFMFCLCCFCCICIYLTTCLSGIRRASFYNAIAIRLVEIENKLSHTHTHSLTKTTPILCVCVSVFVLVRSVWEKTQSQFWNYFTLYAIDEDVLIQTNKWSAITVIMITVDGVFVAFILFFLFLFYTEIKTKCSLPFFGTFDSETKQRSGKKGTYIILFLSVELTSAILIALTTDRIVCVFKRVVYVYSTVHTMLTSTQSKNSQTMAFSTIVEISSKTEALQFVGHNR